MNFTRRDALTRCGTGLGMLALAGLCAEDGRGEPGRSPDPMAPRPPHFPGKAKRVVHLFMNGGPSQVDTFDPKPALNRYAGKSLAETPLKDAFESPFVKENFRPFVEGNTRTFRKKIYQMQVGHRPRGHDARSVHVPLTAGLERHELLGALLCPRGQDVVAAPPVLEDDPHQMIGRVAGEACGPCG